MEDLREQLMELTLVNKQLRRTEAKARQAQEVAEEKAETYQIEKIRAEQALMGTIADQSAAADAHSHPAEIVAAAAQADATAKRLSSTVLCEKHEKELGAVLEHGRLLQVEK
jgi:hypothetical protein